MEDIEEITTEVTERTQTYLDSRRDEASSIVTDSFRRNTNNNWGQKTKVEDLQSARYQGDLEAVMDRLDQLKVSEEGKKKLSTKSSSEKIGIKMKAVDANQKDRPTDMNDQQYKQPWRKSNHLITEGKGSASAISSNEGCKIHQQVQQWRTINKQKPREAKREREKADTHKTKPKE